MRSILIGVILILVCINISKAQQSSFRITSSTIVSKITDNSFGQDNYISTAPKVGYTIGIEFRRCITRKMEYGLGLGYSRLGTTQLTDGQFVFMHEHLKYDYPPFGVVRFKDIIKLNYYYVSAALSHRMTKYAIIGIAMKGLIFKNGQIKSNVYITDQAAEYPVIFWYDDSTQNPIKKVGFVPEVFAEYELGSQFAIRTSVLHSFSRVYQSLDKKYHLAISIGLSYKFKKE